MGQPRLDAETRRAAIVEAALPLFAHKGFAATTTREIAQAAGVSEALIFKHFPSKAALYAEIVRHGCEGEPELQRLIALQPCTATLVHLIHALLRHFVLDVPADAGGRQARHRLVLASLLEDGEYARSAYDWVGTTIAPLFQASLQSAAAAGHLVEMPVSPVNRFWFAEHLAAMLATLRLPRRSVVVGSEDGTTLLREASWFILRGLGLQDAVIAEALEQADHQGDRS